MRRTFLPALIISGMVHLTAFSSVLVWAFFQLDSLPVFLQPYGDSDREGISIGVVSMAPGSFHSDPDAPLGREMQPAPLDRDVPAASPNARVPGPTEDDPANTEPAKPLAAESVPPKPEVTIREPKEVEKDESPSDEGEKPVAPPKEKPAISLTEISKPAPEQKPTSQPGPIVKAPTIEPGSEKGTISPGPTTSGGTKKTNETGGSRLPPGIPPLGGTPGVGTGVQMMGLVRPTYPREAQLQGIQGRVVLWLHVSEQGTVAEARVQESSGHKILDDAALEYGPRLRFLPARRGNQPVATTVLLPVRYRLTDGY